MADPRLFAVPLGTPYPRAFVEGFMARFGDLSPAEIARITIYTNTRRMAGAIGEAFAARGPGLLPRLLAVTDLAQHPAALHLPPPADPLALHLELTQLTSRLLESDPSLAPADAAFDIAGTLMTLLGEMASEGVSTSALGDLDLSSHSAHWARSLRFIDLVSGYLDSRGGAVLAEAHLRAATLAVVSSWTAEPPANPVIIAGSTGSRGTTRILMEAVARSATGYVVLPGLDPDLPPAIWPKLGEAHPQYRFKALCDALDIEPGAIEPWASTPAPTSRAKVLSLALRPPPVTDQWLTEGARLDDLPVALSEVTLLEAPNERLEAVAIALGLRDAVEHGRRACLVTPDRNLTRRVTATLTRWGIEPDDSAGRPLALSAPGRLLRQVAAIMTVPADADALLALLKHPLVASGGGRGDHLINSREVEIWLRKEGAPFRGPGTLEEWAGSDEARKDWARWLASVLEPLAPEPAPLGDWLAELVRRSEALCAGPENGAPDELWAESTGEAALQAIEALRTAAPSAGQVHGFEALRILDGSLQDEVRNPILPHADVMIRGTIEVRALHADLVILAGLNDGTWPPAPDPDPWLNRSLRLDAGLLSPDRRIGLSAHDFEQGFNAPEVWLTRTLRSDDGETVPSRWLNRLTGLVGGLSERNGGAALDAMKARGAHWSGLAEAIDLRDDPVPPAPRPAPRPPVALRPRKLSVTAIQTLIRDPYAIYARHVLGLQPLPAPLRDADARLRGIALHAVAERFIRAGVTGDLAVDRAALIEVARDVLQTRVPWPVTRALWLARLDRIAEEFLAGEYERRAEGRPIAFETKGKMKLDTPEFTLTGTADRIDRVTGGIAIYDYKSGSVPSADVVKHFDRQLLLEAVMAEDGAFGEIGAEPVAKVAHIGMGANPVVREYDLASNDAEDYQTETVLAEFRRLLAAYLDPGQGFASRRAMEKVGYEGDYDHLARYGEWDETLKPVPEDVP